MAFLFVRILAVFWKGDVYMHIPDGYLSPQTAVPMLAVMVPIMGVAVKQVEKTVRKKEVPLLACAAAFSFIIMMFNLPMPGWKLGSCGRSSVDGYLIGALGCLLRRLSGPDNTGFTVWGWREYWLWEPIVLI
jgi:hypothetical protein